MESFRNMITVLIFTFPDFSGDCLILSYDGGARRIGDGDPEADCAEVP